MSKGSFTEEQIIKALNEQAAGMSASDLCRQHGSSDAIFDKWRSRYGGMELSDTRKLKARSAEGNGLTPTEFATRTRPWLNPEQNPLNGGLGSRSQQLE